MKDKEERPKLTIIDELNQSLKDEAVKDMDIPTVQSIAESIGIDERTLNDWLYGDAQFATELHRIKQLKDSEKEMLEKFPELAWTEEEKEIIGDNLETYADATLIALVLMETKERKNLIN